MAWSARSGRGRSSGWLQVALPKWLLFTATLLALSCSEGGGGCGGCSSLEPIPGGYPIAARIENAAQVRVTDKGLGFLEDHFQAIVDAAFPNGLDFEFTKATLFDPPILGPFTICDDNDCSIHIEVDSIALSPKNPNHLTMTLNAIVDSRDTSGPPGQKKTWDGTCDFKVDTTAGSRDYAGLKVDIAFESETQNARKGYTYARIVSITEDSANPIEGADIQVSGGFVGSCALLNFDLLKDFVLDQVMGPLSDKLTEAFDERLCTKPGESGCPSGTFSVGSGENAVCRYSNDSDARCVPTLLGLEGQGDFGNTLLGKFSAGTHGRAQFVVASGGQAEAVANGMSFFLYGGLRSMDPTFSTSPAHNACVPVVQAPALPTVPRAGVFRGNAPAGLGTTPDIGLGLSERFLNHAGYGVYDSGMLCLAVGTRLSSKITTGLFSLLIRSLKNVIFPDTNAPVSIALRPSKPPTFEVGTGADDDPLLTLVLDDLSADFYVWTQERYVRFMTFSGDISISLDLEANGDELQLSVGELKAENSSVTNSGLLEEDPKELATLIEMVLTSFAGELASSVPPFTLPSLLGFKLDVPDGGIVGVEDSGEEFLSVFANLEVDPNAVIQMADTEARLERVDVDKDALSLAGLGKGPAPMIHVTAKASGREGVAYEFSDRVDEGSWSKWSQTRQREITSPLLYLQGRHAVEVRSRVVGAPRTRDLTPASLEVVIDVVPPDVRAARTDAGVEVSAWDAVSNIEALRYRFRLDDGDFGAWLPMTGKHVTIPADIDQAQVSVEVQDEAGNVRATTAALIRGTARPNSADACDCSVPGERSRAPWSVFLIVLGLVVAVRGRRHVRRALPWLSAMTLFVIFVVAVGGCSCSDGSGGPSAGPCDDKCGTTPMAAQGDLCCEPMDMCVPYDRESFCDPGFICAEDALTLDEACALSCSSCVVKPALELGDIGAYMDTAVTSDGTIVASAYSAGAPPGSPYGDLVVGTVTGNDEPVTWEILDGAPDSPITNDPEGWRGGISAPGDDVGRYTSIAEANGTFYVAYYDRTNGALKIATGSAGNWAIHVVDDTGDSGMHASLVLMADGRPAVAYVRIDSGEANAITGSVVVATAASATPTQTTDWTTAVVASKNLQCRKGWCADGTECLESGACAVETNDCPAACAKEELCVLGACQPKLAENFTEDLPPTPGLYADLERTSTGLGLVYYDRSNGSLYGARSDGATWQAPFVIDGYASAFVNAGDSGMSASLAVDGADVWHVAYVDGTEELLKYAKVDGITVTTATVDAGIDDGMTSYGDGHHLVGDDASIAVTASGEVRIVYQDTTAHTAILASRATPEAAWTHMVLDDEKHTGFWLTHHVADAESTIIEWWRGDGTSGENGVRVLKYSP